MSDIVHSHAEHVEKKRRVLRGNTMSCRHRSMVGSMANPPPLSRLFSRGRYLFWGRFRCNWPLLFTPKVFALPWHDDVSHIMHMLPWSAYFWHHICHLLSLDMFYNATCLVLSHIWELCCLMSFSQASHNICEICNAILFNQASYIWMIYCPSFSSLHFHLSTMFVH